MYIEIQDGISINIEEIEGIEKKDETTCKVYTHHRVYLSTYPYSTLLELLKQEDIVDKKHTSAEMSKNTMEKLDKVLGSVGHFAG